MAGLLQHLKVSAIADGPDTSQVQPSDWNAAHVFAGGNHGAIPVRDTSDATYGSGWLASVAAGQVLISNGLAALPSWSPSLTLSGNLTAGAATFNAGPVTCNGLGDAANGLVLRAITTGRPVIDLANATTGLLVELVALNTFGLQLYTGDTLCAVFSRSSGSPTGQLTLANMPDADGGLNLIATGTGRPTIDFRNAAGGSLVQFTALNTKGIQIWTNGGLVLSTWSAAGDLTIPGKLDAAGGVFKSGTAYTHPKWALEHGFTGAITQCAEAAAADGMTDYHGRLSLDQTEAFAREWYDLPLMAYHQDGDLFLRGDLLLASVEEAYLHLFDLHHRIAALEARRA